MGKEQMSNTTKNTIAVLLPCYNEGLTINKLVSDFKAALPQATVYVYDNMSSDDTVEQAKAAGAVVRQEPRRGKGNVIRRMFSDVDADIYVMADGDGTYAAQDAPKLIDLLTDQDLSMVVGHRQGVHQDAGRRGHAFGNRLFNRVFKWMFEAGFTDIFSGYRVFSRRFVKSFPALSTGFETETEMSVHALTLKLPTSEAEVSYDVRPEGSESKLRSVHDGVRILSTFFLLMKEVKPMVFFTALSGLFALLSLWFGVPVILEFFETGLVDRIPSWILSVGAMVIALMLLVCGLILDSLARFRREQKHIAYLSAG